MKNRYVAGIMMLLLVIGSVMLLWLNEKQIEEDRNSDYYYMNYSTLDFLTSTDTLDISNRFQLILFFHSDCSLCEYEAERFKKLTATGIVDLIWVSGEKKESMKEFASQYGLMNQMAVHIAHADSTVLIDQFKLEGYPSYILYDEGTMNRRGKGVFREGILWDLMHEMEEANNQPQK